MVKKLSALPRIMQMNPSAVDVLAATNSIFPLSGLVTQHQGAPYADRTQVIDYVGYVETSMSMRGCIDADSKSVVFRIGARNENVRIDRPNAMHRYDTSMSLSDEIQRQCQEMARKSTSLPTTWPRADLFGVVKRLAMGCAHYSLWGTLSSNELRGAGNVQIASISSVISPIAVDIGSVFVSAKLVSRCRPNVMAALVNAISGEEGTMYTDLLGVNALGVVQVPEASNASLAQGCHDANQILGAMFRACGQGEFFALANAEAVHCVKSVHGHSDEGAYFRDVLRAGDCGIPYGAIVVDIIPETSIPTPTRSVAGFRSVYDGIALATAGAVALCDPCTNIRGKDYPTVLCTDRGVVNDPGIHNNGDANDSHDLTEQWAQNAGAFATLYSEALGRLFSTSGGSENVIRRLTMKANLLANTDKRHMRYKSAVAFFWIEPTCSCPVGDDYFPAFSARHGPLALVDRPSVIPALDGAVLLVDRSDSSHSTVQVDFRYPRKHGLFLHLTTHRLDGLAHVILETAVPNDIVLAGGQGDFGTRVLNRNSIDQFMWTRGQNSLVGGGELISLSETNVFTVEHTRPLGANGYRVRNTHTPNASELLDGDVCIRASRMSGGAPVNPPEAAVAHTNVNRNRCAAGMALSMAADAGRAEQPLQAQNMRPSLIDYGPLPASSVSGIRQRFVDLPIRTDVGAPVVPNIMANGNVTGAIGAIAGATVVNGVQAPVTIEHSRDRGPRPPRPGRAGVPVFVPGGPRGPIPPAGAGPGVAGGPGAPGAPPAGGVPPVGPGGNAGEIPPAPNLAHGQIAADFAPDHVPQGNLANPQGAGAVGGALGNPLPPGL